MKKSNKLFILFFILVQSSVKVSAQSYYTSLQEALNSLDSLKIEKAVDLVKKLESTHPEKWEVYYLKSQIHLNKKEYVQAIEMVNSALEKQDADYISCHFLKGVLELKLENISSAFNEFDGIVNEMGKESSKKHYKSDLYLKFSRNYRAETGLKLGRYIIARADFDSIYETLNQGNSELFQWGYAHWKTGNYDKSEMIASKILEKNIINITIEMGKSASDFVYDTLWRRNHVKEALSVYNKSLNQFYLTEDIENGEKLLFEMFNGLVKEWKITLPIPEKVDLALRDSIRAAIVNIVPMLDKVPDLSEEAREHVVQANIYNEDKKYSNAIESYSKAIVISPWYANGYYNRALLKAMSNNYEGAIADMDLYIKLSPSSPDTRAAKDKIYEWKLRNKDIGNHTTNITKVQTLHSLFLQDWINIKQTNKMNHIYFSAGGSFGAAFQLGSISVPSEKDLMPIILFQYRFEAEVYPLKKLGIGIMTGGINGLSSSDDKITITHKHTGLYTDIFLMKKSKMKSKSMNDNITFLRFAAGNARFYGNGVEKDLSTYTFDKSTKFGELGFGFGFRNKHFFMNDYFGLYYCDFGNVNYNITSSPISSKIGYNKPWTYGSKNTIPVSVNYSRFIISLTFGFYL